MFLLSIILIKVEEYVECTCVAITDVNEQENAACKQCQNRLTKQESGT